MNKRLEIAVSEFRQAQDEHRKAQAEYKKTQDVTKAVLDAATYGKEGKERFQALRNADKAINEAGQAENNAKTKANIAQAVLYACGVNVANIAGNVFMDAVKENEKAFSVPVHYKRFKTAFEKVLPDDLFYFDDGRGYSFNVVFRPAAYGHNSAWVYSIENGCLKLNDDRDKKKTECTLDDIKREAKQAVKDSEDLRKAVDAIRKNDKRENYVSPVRYLMPYFEYYNCIRDDYKLF